MGSGVILKKKEEKPLNLFAVELFLPFPRRKDLFIKNHTNFTSKVLTTNVGLELDNVQDLPILDINSNINNIYYKYESILKKANSSKNLFSLMMKDLYAEKIIMKKLQKPKYDIFKIIDNIFINFYKGNKNTDTYKNTIFSFQKEFEQNLNYINYSLLNLSDNISSIPNELLVSIDRNLKYNEEYCPNMISFILNETLLSNQKFVNDLKDLIQNSKSLRIVSFILYPKESNDEQLKESFGLSCLCYQSLFLLTSAVSKNRDIKAFFFHSIKDYDINLAPEIFKQILIKLQSETLVAFHLGNFRLSDNQIKNLCFQIANTRLLKFLSLNIYNIIHLLNTEVLNSIKKNNSILFLTINNIYNCNSVSYDLEYCKKEIDSFENSLYEHIDKNKDINTTKRSLTNTKIEYFYISVNSLVDFIIEDKEKK